MDTPIFTAISDWFLRTSVPTWLILLGALLPAALWGSFFLRKDMKQPEPQNLLRMTFIVGFLCTIPIVWYARATISNPEWGLYAIAGTITSVEWARMAVFYLAVALIEEYVKHVAMVYVVSRYKHEFTQVVDGIVYAIAAAMGFAFLENAMYLGEAAKNVIVLVFLSRAVGATLGHAIFSGVFGYFYGRAMFAKDLISKKRETLWDFHRALPFSMGLHILRTHVLPRRGIMEKGHTRAQLIAEGYWAAVVLHFTYNALASGLLMLVPSLGEYDLTYLVVPLVLIGLWWILQRFANPANQRIHRAAVNMVTLPEYFWPTERARKIRAMLRLGRGL